MEVGHHCILGKCRYKNHMIAAEYSELKLLFILEISHTTYDGRNPSTMYIQNTTQFCNEVTIYDIGLGWVYGV